jgi:hypothetical protein
MPTMGGVPFVQNTSEPCTNGSTEPRVTGNPTHFNEGSVNMQGRVDFTVLFSEPHFF